MDDSFDWQCPFCNRHATITGANCSIQDMRLSASNFDNRRWVRAVYIRCPNESCHQYTLEVCEGFVEDLGGVSSKIKLHQKHRWQLIPESSAKPFSDYIPEQIRADYREACLIKDKSPKASATLSRRCLQGMIRDFQNIKKKNLSQAINALQGKIDAVVWKAIDSVRKMGNIGAHMEKNVNLIIDVSPREAELLINLIERLMKEWYIDRHEREKEMNAVIELAEKKDAVRKSKKEAEQATAVEPAKNDGASEDKIITP